VKYIDENDDFKGKLHKAGFNLLNRYVKGDEEEKHKLQETITQAGRTI